MSESKGQRERIEDLDNDWELTNLGVGGKHRH